MSTTDHSGECPVCEEYPESFGCLPREKGDDCKNPRILGERRLQAERLTNARMIWIGADGRAHWRVTDDRGIVTECCGGKHGPTEGLCLDAGQLRVKD